jgi:hypothetical protein
MSHRVRRKSDTDQFLEASVKYCGDQFFWTTVVFKSDREIARLIAALKKLKRAGRSKSAHFHLQDRNLSKKSSPVRGEIVFSRVSWVKDPRNYYRKAVVDASRFLELARWMYYKMDWHVRKKGAKGEWLYPIITCRVRWTARKNRGELRFLKSRKRRPSV